MFLANQRISESRITHHASRTEVSSFTSTENSGLLAHILLDFEASYNARVGVIAVGTGQPLFVPDSEEWRAAQ
jgi:ABC-type tungstate transport system permease subunit